ncbi:MAG: cache domain-containing protein [Lachnospiraceae bacterium]|nr:cache domain-containing protein [Lachnospiraceae bacterium]
MGLQDTKEVLRKGKLLNRVIYVAMATVVIMAAILTTASSLRFKTEVNELAKEMLMVAGEHLKSEMESTWDGGWSYDEELGGLIKGGVSVSNEYLRLMDELHESTGIDYTIFWDKTRKLTTIVDNETGERIVGTDASEAVIKHCLEGGEHYFIKNVIINKLPYSGYYIPLQNADGSILGMFFAGRIRSDIDKAAEDNIRNMLIIAVACIAIIATGGLLLAQRVSKFMKSVADDVTGLSHGDLKIRVNDRVLARKDELGTIGENIQGLVDRLGSVISRSKGMAKTLKDQGTGLSDLSGQATEASNNVAHAIDEIAKGSITQRESIQTAVSSTDNIGGSIDDISTNVGQLSEYADQMNGSCSRAMKAMEELIASNSEVAESVNNIGSTIESTNLSAQEISQFTDAIAGIASQTNLLSLNASIEAARAGEAGRGFAVVADEIRELAEQSRASADKIKAVVDKLVTDAEASVKVMGTLNSNFSRQGEQLTATREDMQVMSQNADSVAESASEISKRISNLTEARNDLVGVIEDLSSVSEANAAAAEETNASMQELTATFSLINDSASELLDHASELDNTISYFKD